jgi:hypothetical protein
VRVYIYQANAWYGGGRVFEIEFQFQLVLSLVLGSAKQTSKGLVLGAVLGAKVWCFMQVLGGAKQGC